MYISCEKFTNELIEALRGNKHTDEMKEFRKKYRSVDVLMIDDIQFISKTVSTQEELFHTFNDLYNQDKQIIICSDRPPHEIAMLEERLRTRFQGGVVADISEPDLETRIAILKSEALAEKQNINDDILKLVADRVKSNIREMKGVLTKIICYAQLICKNVQGVATSTAKEIEDEFTAFYGGERKDDFGEKLYEFLNNYLYNTPKKSFCQ